MDNNQDMRSMMAKLMQDAQDIQKKIQEAQMELEKKSSMQIVVGQAGGDLVKAHVSLKMQVTRLECQPALYQEKAEVIEELIASAVNQGLDKARKQLQTEMRTLAQKMGLPADFSLPFNPNSTSG